MKSIYLCVTPNCNLKCAYCFQKDCPPESPSSKDYHTQPGVKASAKVVDAFVWYCARNGVSHVEMFGGEPLFYRDLFLHAVSSLFEKVPGITIGVTTNGTLLTEEIISLFEARSVSILLSLDGDKERHDELRGGFDRIKPWLPRLAAHAARGKVTVAVQAARVHGLSRNVRWIWEQGFNRVYLNVIENYDWYRQDDVDAFEEEYESVVRGMIQGLGEAACATQFHRMLRKSSHDQACGITRKGLACDWNGLLYPCHRAVELGSSLAIGNIFAGVDENTSRKIREKIEKKSYRSPFALKYPLASFCPVAIYQKQKDFAGAWNREYCEMISAKARVVSKYFYELEKVTENQIRA